MAKLPIDEIRGRYDNLVRKIINNLKKVIEDLMQQKKKIMKQRRITIADIHQGRKELFTANKGEFYANAEAKSNPEFEDKKQRIVELEGELKTLLQTELGTEGRVYRSHDDYQKAMDVTIGQLNNLLNYIHNNSGVGRGWFRSDKGKRRHLPVEAIYRKIMEFDAEIMKRERDEELTEEQFLRFKLNVERKADVILQRLETVTGVKTTIKKPLVGRVRRSLGKAKRNIRKKFTGARQKVAGGVTGVGGTLPNWVKRNPNPVPALQNWWSSVSGTARRLREKAGRRGADVSEEQVEVKAEAETTGEAEGRLRSLLSVIKGIKNLNPRESEKLVRLGNKLSLLQSKISSNLRKLRMPRLSRKETAVTAAKVEEAAEVVGETIKEIESKLSKFEALKVWLRSRTPEINLRGAAGNVRDAAGAILQKIKNILNPLPTLEKWWNGLAGKAGNLADIAKSKGGNIEGAVTGFKSSVGGNLGKVNNAVKDVIGRARGILKTPSIDIKARERISGWVDQLRKLQSKISSDLRKLNPGLPREQIGKIANLIKENSKKAAELAGKLRDELGKIAGRLRKR